MHSLASWTNPPARRSIVRALSCFSLLLTMLVMTPPSANADEYTRIIRVEEDWELAIADPDSTADVPQVACVFGPADPDTDTHCVFELNGASLPYFNDGGMQLQCWYYNHVLTYKNHPDNTEFDAAVDYVTFTTVTKLQGDLLFLEIVDGDSLTWGSFGGEGYLRVILSTWRENLNNYDADHSVEHSRVTFGANRVNRFVRREVRFYTEDGLHETIEEDAYVHQLAIDDPTDGPDSE